MNVTHYVPLESFVREPSEPRPACRSWRDGSDWSTKPSVVTCPRCLRTLTANDAAAQPPQRRAATATR